MLHNSRTKIVLSLALSLCLLATGCAAQWISAALADLPVLLQMSLNLGTLATTLQSGRQMNPAETAAIQNIAAEAGRDLNLLQALYKQYEASPSTDALQKIQAVIGEINQNLPALLQAAHVLDPVLSARVTAAVNLVLSTVNSFAALIPQNTPHGAKKAVRRSAIPHADDLKKQWNQQVCGPTGKTGWDTSFFACPIR